MDWILIASDNQLGNQAFFKILIIDWSLIGIFIDWSLIGIFIDWLLMDL